MGSLAAVVLVNFRCAELLSARAGEALAEGHHVVVTDNSGEYQGPGTVVRPGLNLGFGAGCNRAVATVAGPGNGPRPEWICLVNPDTVLEAGMISDLIDDAQERGLDVVAPTLETGAGRIERGYHRPQLAREVALTSVALWRHRRSTAPSPDSTMTNPQRGSRRLSIGAVVPRRRSSGPRFGSGAFLVIRTSAWEQVGGFDERFVLYGEDLDLWFRMERDGLRLGFADDLVVSHAQGQGSPTPRIDRDVLRWSGIELFQQLHHGSSWRRYRRIHRWALARLLAHASAQPGSPVSSLIGDAWSAGADAIETGEILRRAFDDGLMSKRGSTKPPESVSG